MNKTIVGKIQYYFAIGFGLGLLPFVPGTWGTLGGIVLFLLLWPFSLTTYLIVTLIAFVFGCWICEKVAQQMKVYDHGSVVWDEVVGYCVGMITAPKTITAIIIGFILFRIFDIIKPWPICWVDKHMKSGIGMMLDDILAGVIVCILFQLYKMVP
jgi:phosphatidylglycerophosphatase A